MVYFWESPFFYFMIEKYLDYIEFEKRYSVHTVKAYRNDLNQYEEFLSNHFQLNILKAEFVQLRTWVVYLGNDGISKSSINRKITAIRSFYRFYKLKGHIDNNPASKINLLRTPKRLPVFVEEDNMKSLFSDELFSDDFEGVLAKTIINMLYETGMRIAELVNLKMYDVDLQSNQLKVLGKRNKERMIPITNNLKKNIHLYIKERNTIEVYEEDEVYFFIGVKGKGIYNKFVYRLINHYLGLVTTIKKRSPHVIRHTFATHMLNKGADLNAIKEILGHASLSATQIYTHNSIEQLKYVYKQAHPKA